jgi:hypothetical protein
VRILLALLAFVLVPIATAADLPQPQRIDDIPSFLVQQRDIRDAVENDKQYRHVNNTQRDRLKKAPDTRFAALEGRSDIAGPSDAQRIAVFNAQEMVNAFLLDADLGGRSASAASRWARTARSSSATPSASAMPPPTRRGSTG